MSFPLVKPIRKVPTCSVSLSWRDSPLRLLATCFPKIRVARTAAAAATAEGEDESFCSPLPCSTSEMPDKTLASRTLVESKCIEGPAVAVAALGPDATATTLLLDPEVAVVALGAEVVTTVGAAPESSVNEPTDVSSATPSAAQPHCVANATKMASNANAFIALPILHGIAAVSW